MAKEMIVKELHDVVVRFSGDSGDGMQLAGNMFSNISATEGNDISTFPDYPADIRAPQGTLTGVSGFQVHIGSGKVYTPGSVRSGNTRRGIRPATAILRSCAAGSMRWRRMSSWRHCFRRFAISRSVGCEPPFFTSKLYKVKVVGKVMKRETLS